MTKYKDAPYYRINKWLENKLRGIAELNGTPDLTQAIIPQATDYVTDVDTNDRFQDSTSSQEVPFFSPGATMPETMTIYHNSSKIFEQLPVATYTISLQKVHDAPWNLCGMVTYTFMFDRMDVLGEILNYIEALTKREDRSAYDCNWFFRNDATYPFDMKNITFLHAAGPIPSKDEGGINLLMISIGYDATYEGTNRIGEYGDETADFMWN